MTRIAVVQPNYLPWRGYFDLISQADIFIFHDDIQYTKQDWRNRNKFCTLNGNLIWLSIPVKAKKDTLIMDVEIDYSTNWARKHLAVLEQNYGRAPFFKEYFSELSLILQKKIPLLSDLDITLSRKICHWLNINTEFLRASELKCGGSKDDKLIMMIKKIGGTQYLSGPAAKAYIQPDLWQQAGVDLEYITYPDYPAYPQISRGFEPYVSILDLLFMTGPDAPRYIWPDRRS